MVDLFSTIPYKQSLMKADRLAKLAEMYILVYENDAGTLRQLYLNNKDLERKVNSINKKQLKQKQLKEENWV